MQWENLTASEFEAAVQDSGVCLVNFSVMEKHSDHLPIGTDLLLGHRLACLAAKKEPAVVFPPYYFGKVYEAKCYPGAIALPPELLIQLARATFDEIGRNGFKKILIFNSHGGNRHMLEFLSQCVLAEEKPYSLYLMPGFVTPHRETIIAELCPQGPYEHAGEIETSLALALFPELVRETQTPGVAGVALNRLDGVSNLTTPVDWYSKFPEHYAGDAPSASAEKGETIVRLIVDSIAEYIAAVKHDNSVPALTREFFQRVRTLSQDK